MQYRCKTKRANRAARRLEILGEDSIGYLWPVEEEEEQDSDSEDEGDDPYEHPRNKQLTQLGRSLTNLDEDDDARSCSTLSAASSVSSSPATDATEDGLLELSVLDLNAVDPRFHTEAQASIARAYEEDHSVDNARLEYRTLIMAYNAPLDTSRAEVSKFLMSQLDISGGAAAVLQSATKIWERWGELATSLSSDNANIALDVQRYCVEHEAYRPFFGVVLRGLYESDVLAEEDLVEWRSLSEARGDGAKEDIKGVWAEVFLKGKTYVDVLEQMDSESEDEDDDEDEDDGDDDDDEDDESD